MPTYWDSFQEWCHKNRVDHDDRDPFSFAAWMLEFHSEALTDARQRIRAYNAAKEGK